MNLLFTLIGLAIGFVLGLLAALLLRLIQGKTAKELAEELLHESDAQKKANIDLIIENIKARFGSLSLDVLSKSTKEFLKLAKARLESEREVSLKELDAKKVKSK